MMKMIIKMLKMKMTNNIEDIHFDFYINHLFILNYSFLNSYIK